jgi:hypothetical protein
MCIITTINPYGNFDAQKEAISSWISKFTVYSVNTKLEIEIAKPLYPDVKFIETDNTFQYNKKTLIKLSAILQSAKQIDSNFIAIINSDIILSDKIKDIFINKYLNDGIIIGTRWELDENESEIYPFKSGYDIFIFSKKYIDLFNNTKYVIGLPWWDFYIPLIAIKSGLNVYHIKNKVIFHRTHTTNYDDEVWVKFGEFLYQDIMVSLMKNNMNIGLLDFCRGTKSFIEKKQIDIKLK